MLIQHGRMLSNGVGGCADNSLFSLLCCCCFVLFKKKTHVNMLLFALYIVFIGLCYHQYNENFLYDSRFLKNDSISRLVIRHLCVNSAFINSKLQLNFCRNSSKIKNSHFNHNICISLLLILSGDINKPRSHYQISMWHLQQRRRRIYRLYLL